MYNKYNTEALVLGTRDSGEADKLLALYTRDFGLVRARATALRGEKSKMRYALQKFSRARISLVKGKRGWRAAGAVALAQCTGNPAGIAAFARVAELVLRLVHGEEQSEYLFAVLCEAHSTLVEKECEAPATIEIVCVARVLFALGYLSQEALETTLLSQTSFGDPQLSEAERLKDKLLLSINKAIAQTHL
ncbi:MAG TPA: recombination protein O N-terminal domain-containing protein [Candidatus Paceibacterota bacterium]|nr:recombination protein O N-terminal domain-containing protein [Candidatus Paceibacterota bacterium]